MSQDYPSQAESPDQMLDMGKPLKKCQESTVINLSQVESMAAIGMTIEQISAALGVSEPTLRKRRKEYAELNAAIQRGQAKGTLKVAGALMRAIEAGDVKAMTMYLKCRAGWKETVVQEQTGEVSVTITRRVVRGPLETA